MFLHSAGPEKKEEEEKRKMGKRETTPSSKKWSQISRGKVGQELSGV